MLLSHLGEGAGQRLVEGTADVMKYDDIHAALGSTFSLLTSTRPRKVHHRSSLRRRTAVRCCT